MKHKPDDPAGEYYRDPSDHYCAEEGAAYAVDDTYDYNPLTITDLVHEVINQREIIGQATYGRPLLAGDGRDTLQDAIEEAADLLQYLVKLKVERESK